MIIAPFLKQFWSFFMKNVQRLTVGSALLPLFGGALGG
jgi:hypothetical protein